MIVQRDAWWWFKLNGFLRWSIARGGSRAFADPVILTEYPKSGGTWLSQMLAAALGIPYPRNRLPVMGSQVIHGVYRQVHEDLDTIVVWRDGRDLMVSYYYHLVFDKPITSTRYSLAVREKLGIVDRRDIRRNLPRFIEWTFNGGYPGYSWKDFIHLWKGRKNIHETSYERVSEDPLRELERAVSFCRPRAGARRDLAAIVDEYSFYNQSNRMPGEEDVTSFVRKGIVGDWKNCFTREACEVFDRYAGDALILLGYESDRSWISQQAKRMADHDRGLLTSKAKLETANDRLP